MLLFISLFTYIDFMCNFSVFGNSGELLGVAAIDIFKTKLQEVYGINGNTIEDAVRSRANHSVDFNATTGISTITCLNQVCRNYITTKILLHG